MLFNMDKIISLFNLPFFNGLIAMDSDMIVLQSPLVKSEGICLLEMVPLTRPHYVDLADYII